MLHYTNGFSCIVDNEREDLIINFIQNIPVINEEGVDDEPERENVASLVMGKQMAMRLKNALSEMLDEDEFGFEEE